MDRTTTHDAKMTATCITHSALTTLLLAQTRPFAIPLNQLNYRPAYDQSHAAIAHPRGAMSLTSCLVPFAVSLASRIVRDQNQNTFTFAGLVV